jgi:hypothetical protein
LALGRYFLQCVLPAWPAPWDHDPASALGLVGLVLLPFFGLWVYRHPAARVWALLAFLGVTPVVVRMTQVFASDSYLPISALGVWSVAALTWKSALGRWGKAARLTLIWGTTLLVPIFVVRSQSIAWAWRSDASLWQKAYELEPTADVIRSLGRERLREGRAQDSLQLALELKARAPGHRNLPVLLGQSLNQNPGLSPDRKAALLQTHWVESPWSHYYLAVFEAQAGHWDEAAQRVLALEQDPAARAALGPDAPKIFEQGRAWRRGRLGN